MARNPDVISGMAQRPIRPSYEVSDVLTPEKADKIVEPSDRWKHAPAESSSATNLSIRSKWAVAGINRSTWAVVGISGSTWAVAGVSWAFYLDAKTFRGSLARCN